VGVSESLEKDLLNLKKDYPPKSKQLMQNLMENPFVEDEPMGETIFKGV